MPVVAVAVLPFVYHHIVEALRPLAAHSGEIAQYIQSEIEQVVEVEGVLLELQLHVAGYGIGGFLRAFGQEAGADVAVGVGAFAFPYFGEETRGGGLAAVYAILLHGLARELVGVGLVEDYKGFREAEAVDFGAQELGAKAVDGADEVVYVAAVGHAADAAAHLGSRLVGEGKTHDVARRNAEFVDDKSVAVRQHCGLSGTGPGHHAHSTFSKGHGLFLPLVEFLHTQIYKLSVIWPNP